MAKKIHHFEKFSIVDGDLRIHLDLSRFSDQFKKAQYDLDSMVMDDMVPYMPMQTGTFINLTRAQSAAIAGSGRVVAAAAPMGRFLYMGQTMVDPETGSTYAREGAEKVLVSQFSGQTNARPELTYSRHAHHKAQKEWFEAAEKDHGKEWIRKTKKTAGGGTRGT